MAVREWNLWNGGSPWLDDAKCCSQMASTHFACKECSMHFSGPMPYMDHLKSARHLKRVAAHRQMEALIGAGAEVLSPDVKLEVTSTATGLSSLQVAPLPFVCKLCDVAMNCEDALIAHQKGKKHQRVLQREEVLRQLAAGRNVCRELPAESATGQASTLPVSGEAGARAQPTKDENKDEDVDLSCRFCGVVLFENLGYKLEHLETDAHRKKKMQAVGGQDVRDEGQKPSAGADAEAVNGVE
ncbi:uncharacterized protein [Dermacentor andersoni]|uniref:uncharacterized protein isoform X1 n=2 Tax=Dermacentor andersoni TaxID=34620 RepID=UPI003B3B1777